MRSCEKVEEEAWRGETSDVWVGVDDGCWRAEEKNFACLCGKRWDKESPTVSQESLKDFAS